MGLACTLSIVLSGDAAVTVEPSSESAPPTGKLSHLPCICGGLRAPHEAHVKPLIKSKRSVTVWLTRPLLIHVPPPPPFPGAQRPAPVGPPVLVGRALRGGSLTKTHDALIETLTVEKCF